MQHAKQAPQSKKTFVLTARHDAIIKAVHSYRFVTALDITRLFFAPTSLKHVREILHLLCGGEDYVPNQYLLRFPLPHTGPGNAERLFTLGARGRSYLQELGIEVDWSLRPTDVATLTYRHLEHAKTLTRFLIAARIFAERNDAGVNLAGWESEYTLRSRAVQVTIPIGSTGKGKTHQAPITVIPDAWLDFRVPASNAPMRPVLVEIDRGTEQQKYLKRHIASRIAFITPNGGYQRMFGTNLVTVAYATTAGKTRLSNMLTWTEEILTDLNKKHFADVFRFCILPEGDELDEVALFQAASWRRPFTKSPVPLLD